ncbi:unnamed protein product [Arabidopsis thaliana]|uniref:Uncharacterized protein n=2 Tax=Arabidopsis thaliana TaxID=3702 RepID=A0A654FNJ8_ARATH|nr:uncharacterized protein AT4G12555 [Arabidopsis thaliana]ANM67488.1 hypothetical protein AT4G12555 [Arabidopsis thaliana]VYS62430.1 unnamed protein product [Arabidopsis thaliana]|eukprot:NP_001329315.1 hypothetical protein AT4G12555 [Arabidopsis thaliana]
MGEQFPEIVVDKVFNLRALETLWSIPTTNIEEYAEIDRKVNIDNSKNASLDCSAKADRGLKVSQALDERATWLYRTSPCGCRGVSEEEEVERNEECKGGSWSHLFV